MDKYIYLDIDGVIATDATYKAARRGPHRNDSMSNAFLIELLDPAKIAMLNTITDATGATFILSSTWRHLRSTEGLSTIALLKLAGLRADFEGTTGMDLGNRGAELMENIHLRGLGPKDYIIIDDDPTSADFLKKIGHKGGRWIQTPEKTGLSIKHVMKAINLLKDDQ
jgi:hypothetical protein